MSANSAEIAKFSSWAQDWWNPEGAMKPLHQINPLRLQVIQKNVDLLNKKVLDVGCGGGLLSEAMSRCHAEVTGIDLSEPIIEVAKSHAAQNQLIINYQVISTTHLVEQRPSHYDVITCMELLEHVPNPCEVIKECAQMIKPGGIIFFATINRNIQSFAKAIIGAEYILQMLPKGTHQYSQFIRPSELMQWALASNLHFKGLQGINYNPLTGTFTLSKDVSVNYIMHFQRSN